MSLSIATNRFVKNIKMNFPIGSKIKILQFESEYINVPRNSIGTVQLIDNLGTIYVELENGEQIGLMHDIDNYVMGNTY